jgi:rubrerythrin
MNIFDYAMRMEKEGEAFYTELALKATSKGMVLIFNELAQAEMRHYETFDQMKKNQNAVIPETSFLNNVKSVFSEWKSKKETFTFSLSQADLYRKALDIEKKSIDFYTDGSKKVTDKKHKELFMKIVNEEKTHYEIMQNIVDFVAQPERWVEHAEFSKIGEEY